MPISPMPASSSAPASRRFAAGRCTISRMEQLPEGKLPALRVMPMPADANQNGDIFGGWIMAQVAVAGGPVAGRPARGRVATGAVNSFGFKQPVQVGDAPSFHSCVVRVRHTSRAVNVGGL